MYVQGESLKTCATFLTLGFQTPRSPGEAIIALIECRECSKEISSEAKSCPHCGAKKYNPHYFLKGVMILAAFLVFKGTQPNNSPSDVKDPAEYVLGTCRNFIKKAAHNPSSVEFGRDYPKPTITSSNIYSMTLPYRAQNGFGAIRKSAATCTLYYNDGSFHLVGLKQLNQ